jgi:hypothetical protein
MSTEHSVVLSVISYEKRDGRCPSCGETGLIYVCHGFGLDWPETQKIQHRCRPCAERDAGGPDRIWVKTTFPGLRQVWKTGRREWISEKKAEALRAARTKRAHRSDGTAQTAASGDAMECRAVSRLSGREK